MSASAKPIVCILANRALLNNAPAQAIKRQYITPLVEVADAAPLILPSIGKGFSLKSIASKIDGLLLTGSPTHIDPANYGGKRAFEEDLLDADRDATSLPLLRDAMELDIPTLAICRGFQELNVACGGTLHQAVHKLPGKLDHRAPEGAGVAEQYEIQRHNIRTQPGGLFEKLKLPQKFMTNSLHHQGVDRLGKGLFVEGICEDGLIEAVSVPGKRFFLGVQWHPEGDFRRNPVSKMIFEAFSAALRGK
ncbi:MAG: gamma-glutamyl-gamma-aminobutyrate hydrolase family protein [Alphaproteobacteria bacterium]|nr:gamma-glutamyl-gamma-aminobutyrate hydrolase family protein [Alphaproteobacteria bacterium]MDE2336386.1 gamma-glutamyl-gamma-aminobutyrate hydrolase family protein [Alphaproteobacteria bacterium]